MTHSVKVAQVARRIAELVVKEQKNECKRVGGVDPDVVEAAALAHDLGHPPFGHIAENALKEVTEHCERRDERLTDGFEGNAQTFRIVTKLARRAPYYIGLNLTRATLNALLKYPWTRRTGGNRREKKWSVYENEVADFEWVRKDLDILGRRDERKTPEAELMDWGDDIAYSVHDIEDFYRVGAIPLHRLAKRDGKADDPELRVFYDAAAERRKRAQLDKSPRHSRVEMEEAFEKIREAFPIKPFSGGGEERGELREMSKSMIGRFVHAIHIRVPLGEESFVEIDSTEDATVAMLKELTWHYVINNPALATQQYGQTTIIKKLFEVFRASVLDPEEFKIFSAATRESLENIWKENSKRDATLLAIRTAADVVAGMTEQQALRMYRRLMGYDLGSALDRVY